jgi:hypothetical protein
VGAIGSASVNADQKERILQAGLEEASRSFAMVDFDRVDVRLGLAGFSPEITVRATPNGSFQGPPEDAWAPSPAVEAQGMWPRYEVTKSFDAWMRPRALSPFSWDEMSRSKEAGFWRVVKESGFLGGWVTHLPEALVFGARLFSRNAVNGFVPEADASFERVGLLSNGNDVVFYGLLPPKATQADAKKALAALAGKDPKAKATEPPSRILKVDHRFVIVRAKAEALLPKRVTLAQRGPFTVGMTTRELAGHMNLARLGDALGTTERVTGKIAREDKTLVITLGPP